MSDSDWLVDPLSDPRVQMFDRLLAYEDFRALIGGPPPNSVGAKIALLEHLYDNDVDARVTIRRIGRRAFPGAYIPREPAELAVARALRVVRRVIRAVLA